MEKKSRVSAFAWRNPHCALMGMSSLGMRCFIADCFLFILPIAWEFTLLVSSVSDNARLIWLTFPIGEIVTYADRRRFDAQGIS